MSELRIHPELADLVGLRKLTDEEKAKLERSLRLHGCLKALVVWKEEQCIVDGHHRYEICKRAGIGYRTREVSFKDINAAKLFMLQHPDEQRVESTADRDIRLAEIVRLQGLAHGQNKQKDDRTPHGEVSLKEIAKSEGVSKATVERAVQVGRALEKVEKVRPGATEAYRKGELTRKEVIVAAEARPEPAKPIPEESAPPAFDETGYAIPPALRPTFAERGQFASLMNEVSRLKAKFKTLAENPILNVYIEGSTLQAFDAAVGQMRQAVAFSAPYAVCPKCKGVKGCDWCKKSGWLTKARYQQVPAEHKVGRTP